MYNDVENYIRNPGDILWAHGLDVLAHVLKGMGAATAWGNTGDFEKTRTLRVHVEPMSEALKNPPTYDKNFDNLVDTTFKKIKRYKTIRTDEGGDFDVELWMERGGFDNDGRKDFYLEEVKQISTGMSRPLTVVMDGSIACSEVDNPEIMKDRHDQAYGMTLKAEAEGRPCRVIAIERTEYDEKTVTMITTIKDFDDPIFPGIWGAFQDSKIANALGCAESVFLFGTRSDNLGTLRVVKKIEIENLLDGEEVVYAGNLYRIRD